MTITISKYKRMESTGELESSPYETVEISLDRDSLAHEICMGIRKGLFGVDASEHSTILNLKG